MLLNIFRSSSLSVLAQIICPKGTAVIVYDPKSLLIRDESFSFPVEGSCTGLLRRIDAMEPANACVFNLSEDELTIPTPGWLVEFDGGYDYPGMESITLNHINIKRSDSTWIFPSTLRRPTFLAFYDFSDWKAKLYKFVVKTAFILRLPSLIRNGRLLVHHRQGFYVQPLLGASELEA